MRQNNGRPLCRVRREAVNVPKPVAIAAFSVLVAVSLGFGFDRATAQSGFTSYSIVAGDWEQAGQDRKPGVYRLNVQTGSVAFCWARNTNKGPEIECSKEKAP
jgi:hypothetical protein